MTVSWVKLTLSEIVIADSISDGWAAGGGGGCVATGVHGGDGCEVEKAVAFMGIEASPFPPDIGTVKRTGTGATGGTGSTGGTIGGLGGGM